MYMYKYIKKTYTESLCLYVNNMLCDHVVFLDRYSESCFKQNNKNIFEYNYKYIMDTEVYRKTVL